MSIISFFMSRLTELKNWMRSTCSGGSDSAARSFSSSTLSTPSKADEKPDWRVIAAPISGEDRMASRKV
ncbi:hypothetical protein D3C86_2121270 [compost metagenome]